MRPSPSLCLLLTCMLLLSDAGCGASEPPDSAPPIAAETEMPPAVPQAAHPTAPSASPTVETRHFLIDGADRTALVILPPGDPTPSPLVIDFHGHGGTAAAARRSRHFEDVWPQAVVVYPQGEPRVTGRDPEGAWPGWGLLPGSKREEDLSFFDSIVTQLVAEGRVDPARVFVTGHSNGAGFTAFLAAERDEQLAAVAVVHGGSASLLRPARLPIMFIAARNDRIVDFDRQSQVLQALLTRHKVADAPTGPAGQASRIECSDGAVLGIYLHDGSHAYPPEAARMIADFFKSIEGAAPAKASADLSPSPR